jgi:tyrosine decarboxylase/aspartate 1-decarboxylase
LVILEYGIKDLPRTNGDYNEDQLEVMIMEVAKRMLDYILGSIPFSTSQMFKPPHPVARLVYMLSMWNNPNKHALDGRLASLRCVLQSTRLRPQRLKNEC